MPAYNALRIAPFLIVASQIQIACAVHDDGGAEHNGSTGGVSDTSVDVNGAFSREGPNPTRASCDDGSCCPAGWPVVEGDAGPNVLIGGSSSQCLIGLGDDDTLRAGSAGDFLVCGEGNDICEGDSAADTLLGGPGDDNIDGGSGDDAIECDAGNDVAQGGSGHDNIQGGGGNDTLHGGTGDDEIVGGTGNDTCRGDSGNDTIFPGPGLDDIDAGSGSDRVVLRNVCEVRHPNEILVGGSGMDELVTTVSTAEFASIGVTVSGFETVTIDDSQLAKSECFECACEIVAEAVECCSGHGTCELVGDEKESCACDPGFAGPACAFSCNENPECSIKAYRTNAGKVFGLLGYDTTLFTLQDLGDSSQVASELAAFLAGHPNGFDFDDGVVANDFELVPASPDLVDADGITLYRFVQTYRGFPVAAPDNLVTVSATSLGVMSLTGLVADPTQDLEGLADPIGTAAAEAALHEELEPYMLERGIPTFTVGNVQLVAMPRLGKMAYRGVAFDGEFGVLSGTVAAGGPSAGQLLTLDRQQVEAPTNIATEVEDPSSDPLSDPMDTLSVATLITGNPLVGEEEGTGARLSNEWGFVRNATQISDVGAASLVDQPGFTSASTIFGSTPPSLEFRAQDLYFKFLSMTDIVHDLLQGQWDSLLALEPSVMSDFVPGTFHPKTLMSIGNLPNVDCDVACARKVFIDADETSEDDLPPGALEYKNAPPGGGQWEPIGVIFVQAPDQEEPLSRDTSTILHEAGHIFDLFVFPGFVQGEEMASPQFEASCERSTDDERAPLTETVAQLFAIWSYRQLYSVDVQNCGVLQEVSSGDNGRPHHPACPPGMGEAFAADFELEVVPAPGEGIGIPGPGDECGFGLCPGYKEKVLEAGAEQGFCVACNPIDENQPAGPQECLCPTGMCARRPGYAFDSVFQAFWELQFAEACGPTENDQCTLFAEDLNDEDGTNPQNAAGRALLFALRKNAQTYQQLWDMMGAYYACRYPNAYDEFCEIVEHHNLTSCEGSPVCQVCGNGQLEPDEECDDGNASNEDSCLADCILPECGDGFVWAGVEECDDANMSNEDTCIAGCLSATCGDGFVWAGVEECDDGNVLSGDGCSDTCEFEGGGGQGSEGEEGGPCFEAPTGPGVAAYFQNGRYCASENLICREVAPNEFECQDCTDPFDSKLGCPCSTIVPDASCGPLECIGTPPDLQNIDQDARGACWDPFDIPSDFCQELCAATARICGTTVDEAPICLNPECAPHCELLGQGEACDDDTDQCVAPCDEFLNPCGQGEVCTDWGACWG